MKLREIYQQKNLILCGAQLALNALIWFQQAKFALINNKTDHDT